MEKLFQLKLRTALFVSFFVLLVPFLIFLKGFSDLLSYKMVVDQGASVSLNSIHFFARNEISQAWFHLFAPRLSAESSLTTLYFEIDSSSIKDLNSDLPDSGKEKYYDAQMFLEDGTTYDVKMRYRRDNHWHWFFEQKSLRIKMGKMDTFNDEKKFNLIAPQATRFRDKVTYGLIEKYGLLSPDYFPIRVVLNGEYMGVYVYMSQIDESLLRKRHKMPGSIYYGDLGVPLNDRGLSELWFDADYWEKAASRSAEYEEDRSDIDLFIDAVNNYDDLEFYDFFRTYVDEDAYYHFFALDTILGNGHHDFLHNHKIYFDPYVGKFEPIEWDVVDWNATDVKDLSIYPLLNRVKLNPILEYERDKLAYELFSSEDFDSDRMVSELVQYKELLYQDRLSDHYRNEMVVKKDISSNSVCEPFDLESEVGQIELYRKTLTNRRYILKGIYDDVEAFYDFEKGVGGGVLLSFKVDGNSGLKLNFKEKFGQYAKVYRDVNFNGYLDADDTLVDIVVDEILYPGRKVLEMETNISRGDTEVVNASNFYQYLLRGSYKGDAGVIVAKNYLTGEEVSVNKADFDVKFDFDSIHPWDLPEGKQETKILSGNIYIDEDLIFDEFSHVVIKPGTTFFMYPGKSIFFYGKLEALGRDKAPIKFVPYDSSQPWGSVVLQGEGASGGRMDYVEFSGGSVVERNLIHYTGQFNIHDVDDFEVSNCKIGENYIGDDSMHVAYSSGVIDNCLFTGARSDALDVDISDVKVSNSIFIDSGNDALDFMTSEALVENSVFIGSGDKGISVGEETNGVFTGVVFSDCLIGVEVKDKSFVSLKDAVVLDSRDVAVNLYNKNLKYSRGGVLEGLEIYLVGNNDNFKADDRSEYTTDEVFEEYPDFSKFEFVNKIVSGYFSSINGFDEFTDFVKN